jgi:mevalonate kinase
MMLLGEYAVLHDKHALVCAIDKRITVTLTPRSDATITIKSALGELTLQVSKLVRVSPFQFVIATLQKCHKKMPSGCDIVIESEFASDVGLGSSAAVTVALLAALNTWLKLKFTAAVLIRTARNIILDVQGLGSGADVAACVLGGMVAYRKQPQLARRLKHIVPITAIYAGYKTPTVIAVTAVKKTFATQPKIFQQVLNAIDACAKQGIAAAAQADWQALGKIMNIQQGLLAALTVSTPLLDELIEKLRAIPGMHGAKISGSGMGDCVLGLGVAKSFTFTTDKIKSIAVAISTQGVCCEKI